MAAALIACTPAIKKLVKLLKGIDQNYTDSVTTELRKEYRKLISRYYGDDYMLEDVQGGIESGEAAIKDLAEADRHDLVGREVRAMHYLRIIHEELHRKWREMNEMIVGHCGTPCNLGCPKCEPGGYDHASEV